MVELVGLMVNNILYTNFGRDDSCGNRDKFKYGALITICA